MKAMIGRSVSDTTSYDSGSDVLFFYAQNCKAGRGRHESVSKILMSSHYHHFNLQLISFVFVFLESII